MGAVVLLEQRRGPKLAKDGRRRFDLLPHGGGRQGWWLYAVGLPDGRVKVGIASRPRLRIAQHWHQHQGLPWAHVFGRRFTCNGDARHAERYCVSRAAEVAQRIGRSEYFNGIDGRAFVAACREGLAEYVRAHVPATPEQSAA